MINLQEYGLSEDAALYYNVDGIPVSIGLALHPGSVAWDEIPPRPFLFDSVQRNGWMIDFEDFVKLLEIWQSSDRRARL